MGWVSLLSGLLKLSGIVAGMVERRGLMRAGESRAIARANQDAIDVIQRAAAARRAVPKYLDGDKLPDDPDRRD